MKNLVRSNFQAHPFHLVSPSPWPIYTSASLLALTTTGVLTIHAFKQAQYFLEYILLAWELNSPPKPYAFVSLPLQSGVKLNLLTKMFNLKIFRLAIIKVFSPWSIGIMLLVFISGWFIRMSLKPYDLIFFKSDFLFSISSLTVIINGSIIRKYFQTFSLDSINWPSVYYFFTCSKVERNKIFQDYILALKDINDNSKLKLAGQTNYSIDKKNIKTINFKNKISENINRLKDKFSGTSNDYIDDIKNREIINSSRENTLKALTEKVVFDNEITPKIHLKALKYNIDNDKYNFKWLQNTITFCELKKEGIKPSLELEEAFNKRQNRYKGWAYFKKSWIGDYVDFNDIKNVEEVAREDFTQAEFNWNTSLYMIDYLEKDNNIEKDPKILARDINNWLEKHIDETGYVNKVWAKIEREWEHRSVKGWQKIANYNPKFTQSERLLHAKVADGNPLSKWDKARLAFRRSTGKSSL